LHTPASGFAGKRAHLSPSGPQALLIRKQAK